MITIKDLNYIYGAGVPGETHALYDINLEIPTGDLVALIGHTGSGKSTLIQHLNALTLPTSGSVIIDGLDITDKKVKKTEIRRRVGLIFQYPEYQLFEETVFADIAFGPKNLGLSEEEVNARVIEACKLLNINNKLFDRSPFELSGGQKRRVAIAGVIAMKPDILVLDEPVAGLDPKGRDRILEIIKNLHEKNPNMTIIFVSHSMEDVAKVAEHIIVMNNGRVAMTGTVAEVFSHGDELEKIGLSVPQITKIANGLKNRGIDIPDEIYTLKYGEKIIADLLRKGGKSNV